MSGDPIDGFVHRVASTPAGPNTANPFEFSGEPNAIRRRNLTRYLRQLAERRPRVLLVGEAPGYRGMRITGVPFTNTVLLRNGVPHFGLFGEASGYELPPVPPGVAPEPTATVMWQTLVELDFLPALWSAFPLHPHRPGVPLSNRTPTGGEAAEWSWSWRALRELLEIERVVAVGNIAAASLARSGYDVPRVRHPAHGGKVKFASGLRELLDAGIDSPS
ncbi:uracil-DNA glycosylase family protein [Lysobacter korlensis]|uniref:Uracil-DNA glycosylase family protein n=1 Tax=Lysobacter korlensis TaxID=553636 RepID=A0ABV6S0C4_9GAMM